jgi:hypothetical protein
MEARAFKVFSELSKVNFNHRSRDDSQQVIMEPLEIVAAAAGLKPAFVAGQSGYNERFNRDLSRFAQANEFHARQTTAVPVHTQLMCFPSHALSISLLEGMARDAQKPHSDRELIWLFRDLGTEQKITLCVEGKIPMGEVLGYPACCTYEYLAYEAKRTECEVDYYRRHYKVQSDYDILRLYISGAQITGNDREKIKKLCDAMCLHQALSIKQFPFVHFIACRSCMNTPQSPAACLNQKMSELAMMLSKTFARKFVHYATQYSKLFEQDPL